MWQTRRVVQRHHGSKHEVLGASPYRLSLYARKLLLVANFSKLRQNEVRKILPQRGLFRRTLSRRTH